MKRVGVRLAAWMAGRKRQFRLSAVYGLDLRLLIDAEHHRRVLGVQVEADNVAHFVDELGVGRELEALGEMRFQAEGPPDAGNT